jgi:hypothetical protein
MQVVRRIIWNFLRIEWEVLVQLDKQECEKESMSGGSDKT